MKRNQGDTLSILIESSNSRVIYTFSLFFDWVFPLPYRLTTDRAEWRNYDGPRLSYGRKTMDNKAFWLPAGTLLFEKGVRAQVIEVEIVEGLASFFWTQSEGADLPFDLPAMAFYLASRYEEYLSFRADVHGRFSAAQSLAARAGFLRLPLINLWVKRLVQKLIERYPSWRVSPPAFEFLPTFDIDLAWAFLHRPWWIQAGGIGKACLQGRWADLKKRGQTLLGRRADPFFTFPFLRQLHPPGEQPAPIFFFLLGDNGPYDKNIRHLNPAFRSLLAGVARDYEVGIHLSYRSNKQPERIPMEINRLSGIAQGTVLRNRQHFLKLQLPDTYRQLLAYNIREDYSMGYADDIGFRASLANAFPWYDLPAERRTDLMVYPFQVMDVSLKNYLEWTPEEAWAPIWEMVEHTREAGGLFCILWHNSSLGDLEGWAAWRPFYKNLIGEIKAKN